MGGHHRQKYKPCRQLRMNQNGLIVLCRMVQQNAKRFIKNINGQVTFREMKCTNMKWFRQFRNCVDTLGELIQ